jgi:ribokinase
MKDVIGIGALNLDLMYEVQSLADMRKDGWYLQAGRETSLAPEGFKRLLKAVEGRGALRFRSAGGSAANTIVALARMGFKTGYVGRIGADDAGAFILEEMTGVDLEQVRKGGSSGVCLVVLDSCRDRALVVQPNANDDLSFLDLSIFYLSDSRYLHLSAFVGDRPFDAQRRLMEVLPSKVKVSLDPGELYAQRGIKKILPLIERSSILFASAHEICTLMGTADYQAGCKEIASLGPEMVVCKRGEAGAYLFSLEGEQEFWPQVEAEVVDNTGAGDVFNAGFLAALLLKRRLADCLAFAHAIAAKSLGGFGRERYPGADDIKTLQGG